MKDQKEFLKKFRLKPKKIEIKVGEGIEEAYILPLSANMMLWLFQSGTYTREVTHDQIYRVIKYCVCESDGSRVFEDDFPEMGVGDCIELDVCAQIYEKVMSMYGPKEHQETVLKKQDA